ncbi:MAG TPA: hypothetical protein VMH22_05305 [bacterium]|nr:hypothetical protein [bacterium]
MRNFILSPPSSVLHLVPLSRTAPDALKRLADRLAQNRKIFLSNDD